MPQAYNPQRIASVPGIKRDGTRLEGDNYLDGQWVRFQRGRPRKIGGVRSIAQDLPQRVYGMNSFSANARQYLHLGSDSQLQQRVFNNSGIVTASNDRTPVALVGSASNIWAMDQIFSIPDNYTALVAHAAPNMDIDSQDEQPIFAGDVTGAAVLTATGMDPVSGGALAVGNYLVAFSNGGRVDWSDANDFTATFGSSNVTQQKIICGKRVRGGGVPAALLWSLDSLILQTFAPDPDVPEELWDFDIITDETSILSSRCVIEYDGVFYWLGVDRPLAYNGVVREVPNQLNVNYFYDGLNFAQRQKVFAYKVPRFGEIWWCYPRGSAEECTHAIIFNVKENTWYDTELPDEGRTDGIYAKVYNKPLMMGSEEDGGAFDLWQHETGVNRVRAGDEQPIPSHFETHEFSLYDVEQGGENKTISVNLVEPDFVQAGDLQVSIRGRANARSAVIDLGDNTKTITETAADADEQVTKFKTEFRLVSFKFESNELDGNYEAGDNVAHMSVGDGRFTQ